MAARTEGWAAGLQLAALSLREQTDVDGFVAAFTGSHRYVLDYLTEEVLERQDLRYASSCWRRRCWIGSAARCAMPSPGAPTVSGCSSSVDRSGLFLVQLDDVRGWWRYHHLFADLLRARLAQDRERNARAAPPSRVPGTSSAG